MTVVALCLFSSFSAEATTISGKIQVRNVSSISNDAALSGKDMVVVWLEGEIETKSPVVPSKISQHEMQFLPDFLVAVKGDKIEVLNEDDVMHSVYSFTGRNRFDLGVYPKGESRFVTLENTGIVDLLCSIHKSMHARIFVVPNRYFGIALPGQSYTIKNVPPGRYILKAWRERSTMFQKGIVVPENGSLVENLTLESGVQTASQVKE